MDERRSSTARPALVLIRASRLWTGELHGAARHVTTTEMGKAGNSIVSNKFLWTWILTITGGTTNNWVARPGQRRRRDRDAGIVNHDGP